MFSACVWTPPGRPVFPPPGPVWGAGARRERALPIQILVELVSRLCKLLRGGGGERKVFFLLIFKGEGDDC